MSLHFSDTVKHFNLAALKIGDYLLKIILVPYILASLISWADYKCLKYDIHTILIDSQKLQNKWHANINGFTVKTKQS